MGRINCIIVKDLSRFGRNYIETGNYLEKIFPFLGVRFVAVADQFDSQNLLYGNTSIHINLKNLVNEMYAKDIALRVSVSKREKKKNGSYMGGIPPYGYVIEQREQKRVLVEEKGTSDIVKELYQLFLSGKSINALRTWLYRQKINTPMEYRRSGNIFCQKEEPKEWQQKTVKAILSNPIYTGSLKEKVHTHKRIIDEETFAKAAVRLGEIQKNTRIRDKKSWEQLPEDIFSGLLFCGGCGCGLVRSAVKKKENSKTRYIQYRCPKANQIGLCQDEKNSISAYMLITMLKTIIQTEFTLTGLLPEYLIEWNRNKRIEQNKKQKRKLDKIEKRMEYLRRNNSEQYMRFRMGEQGEEYFLKVKKDYEAQREVLNKRREDITEDIKNMDVQAEQREEIVRQLLTSEKAEGMTKDMVQKLVCHIMVWQGRRVEVTVAFNLFM